MNTPSANKQQNKATANSAASSKEQRQALRQELRRELRAKRRALSEVKQAQAADALCKQIINSAEFLRAKRIAFYLPSDGEISLLPTIREAQARGKQCFLPIIRKDKKLDFGLYQVGDVLVDNRYGIAEPLGAALCPSWMLDVVYMPLVGFDDQGNRLGMGGGYYDRTFAFIESGLKARAPRLIGVAHACQRVERLEAEGWDVQLDRNIIA